jgi:hypothetical protein
MKKKSIPICKNGKHAGYLPEGASMKALVCVNGKAVKGRVHNVKGKVMAFLS